MPYPVPDQIASADPVRRRLIPLLFSKRTSPRYSKWQFVYLVIYGSLAAVFLLSGRLGLAGAYILLSLFFGLGVVDLDLFAPASMMAAAFGIYFLLPLAFLPDRAPSTLPYIAGTLFFCAAIYLLLPRLNFGLSRRLGGNLRLRKNSLRIAATLQLLGILGFLLSVRLAGYSNPLGVLTSPLKYRFFMMVGGMTYFSQLLGFLTVSPVIVVALAYYLNCASRKALWITSLVGLSYGLATGARGPVVFLVVQILMVRHLLHKQLAVKLVLLLACVFLPFIAIAGQYRMLKYADKSGTLDEVLSKMSAGDILKLAASRVDASRMFNELMVHFDPSDAKLGESYFALPLQVVPRAFWPDKPRLPNPEMTRIIGKNDPYLDISFDFGIFGETFLNFGWVGIPVGALILVLVVGPMQCLYEYAKHQRSPFCIVAAVVLFFAPFQLVVSGLDQTIVLLAFGILQILLLRKLFFVAGPAAHLSAA